MRDDVFVQVIDLKVSSVNEMVTVNEDGTYTIFLNARVGYNAQRRAYEHALRHIENMDFERTDVQTIEAVAHEIAPVSVQTVKPVNPAIERIRARRRRNRKRMRALEEELRIREMYVPEYRKARYV